MRATRQMVATRWNKTVGIVTVESMGHGRVVAKVAANPLISVYISMVFAISAVFLDTRRHNAANWMALCHSSERVLRRAEDRQVEGKADRGRGRERMADGIMVG